MFKVTICEEHLQNAKIELEDLVQNNNDNELIGQ
jgi:exonuclease VII small subunit